MISDLKQNIFFWDSSANTFTEYTRELNEYKSGNVNLTFDAGDRLYIATCLPFNHRFFKLTDTTNAVTTANLIIEYYTGSGWKTPSRVLDYTESSSATFNQSGKLLFIPDDQYSISQQSDTDTMDDNFKNYAPPVYNMYWQAIGFSETVTIGFSYVGQLFSSSDEEIYARYPLLNNDRYKEQWEAGKTDWEEQRVDASDEIVKELERRAIIVDRNQVLDTASLNDACIDFTAMRMFSGLGVDRFKNEIEVCGKRYSQAMKMDRYNIDVNANARSDSTDRSVRVSLRSR